MDIGMLLILFTVTTVAAIVQGITGFAFGIVMLMVLPFFFTYTESIALVAFMTLFSLLYNAYLYRKFINWKQIPLALFVYIVVDLFAVQLLKYAGDNPIWYTLLGVMFILMAIYMMWGQNWFQIKPTKMNAVIFIGLSGLITGLFGAGGPIAAMYFLVISKNKDEYLGTIQMFFFLSIVIDVVLRIVNGMLPPTLLVYGVSGLWCIVIGTLIGKKLFSLIDALMLRKIVCVLMVMDAIVMFLK